MRILEYTVKIRIPVWLDFFIASPAILYRRIRYSYSFRRIPLTKGKFAIVDLDDYFWLRLYRWSASKNTNTYYAKRTAYSWENTRTRSIAMHREIMNAPKNLVVDHINHNGLDNRKANLRLVHLGQNNRNCLLIKKRDAHSQYRGVTWSKHKKRWLVKIRFDGKRKYIGSFKDEIEAAKAYDAAARKFHKEFAVLNFESPRRTCTGR